MKIQYVGSKKWWESLTQEEKMAAKIHYEEVMVWSSNQKRPFPSMYNTIGIRVSKLSDKFISRIHDFNGYKIKNNGRRLDK